MIPYTIFADQMDNPVNADWVVNVLAPASADSNSNSIVVRRFDDTAEEGVGFKVELPAAATNLTISFRGRAQTAPGGAAGVVLKLYNKDFPDDGALGSWSAGTTLTTISIPTDAYFQYDSQTISFATLGLTAGRGTLFELTRNGADGNDTLTGDWALWYIILSFS
jgi:hypothetical protein